VAIGVLLLAPGSVVGGQLYLPPRPGGRALRVRLRSRWDRSAVVVAGAPDPLASGA